MGTEVEKSEPLIMEPEKDEYDQVIPDWKDQITLRGLAVSALLGCLFCIITHNLNLTVGMYPTLNVAAGLLGFFFVKSWTSLVLKFGFHVKPFTPQENTVIQTCVVACYGIAFSVSKEELQKLFGNEFPVEDNFPFGNKCYVVDQFPLPFL